MYGTIYKIIQLKQKYNKIIIYMKTLPGKIE